MLRAVRIPTATDIRPLSAALTSAAVTASARRGLLIWACAVIWFAATAWIRPLAMPDEGRYLSVAWEMLASGDWLVPTLDGLPFFHKPPLFYWLADIAMKLGGTTAFAGRMPSAFAAGTLVWAMYFFDRRWSGATHARVLLIVLATTPYLYFAAQYANMDMLVATCISVAVLCAAHAAIRAMKGHAPGAALHLAYVAAALGVLAKGLIGCVLPAAVVVVWLLAVGRASLVPRLLSPLRAVAFFAIVLPWPVAMEARFPGFLEYFVVEQQLHRFAGSGFNNAQGWWFYLPVLFVLTLPWSCAIAGAWRRPAKDAPPDPLAPVRMLMICWVAVVVLFFSIPQSKLIGYALPAVPPVAWLLVDGIAAARRGSLALRHMRAIAGGSCILLLATVVSYGARAPHSSHSLATVLAAQRGTGEPVIFFDSYPYDLEFDAQLKPPIPVVQAWKDPSLARRDSWPRELLDEARFAPDAAAARLVEAVPTPLAPGQRAPRWIVGPTASQIPPDVDAYPVAQTSELTLWKIKPRLPEK